MGLTVKEAAEILGIGEWQVAHLCRSGKLIATRHGPMWDIDPASVEAYRKAPKDKGGRPRKADSV